MSENRAIDRKEFLRITGICGAACAVFLSGCEGDGGNSPVMKTCPFGYVNDPFPGQCGDYIDRNQSGFCDYSEVAQASQTNSENGSTGQSVEPIAADTAEASAEGTPTTKPTTKAEPTRVVADSQTTQSNPPARPGDRDTSSNITGGQPVCNRDCSYPGHCRRYTDQNNNGRCDLGEGN